MLNQKKKTTPLTWAVTIFIGIFFIILFIGIGTIDTPTTTTTSRKYLKARNTVNVRDFQNRSIIGQLQMNDSVELIEFHDDWTSVMYNGEKAYIFSKFLYDPVVEAQKLYQAFIRGQSVSTLRSAFLDQSMDVKVRVSGKDNKTLTLTYTLMSDVWVHHFLKSRFCRELTTWEDGYGFTKIIFKDGYNYNQWYSWK